MNQEISSQNRSTGRRKLLFATLEPISKAMAGPAIRCLELAKQLTDEFDVTVFSPAKPKSAEDTIKFDLPGLTVLQGGSRTQLYDAAARASVIFIQANLLKPYPNLAKMGKYLVVDLYDPYLFSLLVQYQNEPVTADSSYRLMHQVLEQHMLAADFSICASERQRDYWIGRYCAQGRINPALYKFDPSMRKLVDVVPFGLPDAEPKATRQAIKGVIPGIAQTDKVLLWGGGVWDWFDPLTVINAVGQLKDRRPDIKLVFMGTKSPNPQVPVMEMTLRAEQLAKDLNLLGNQVFFTNEWIQYADRVNYLLEADVAVSAHFDLIETRMSFRTRILDYLWAGLPILTTGGDEFADLVAARGAGESLGYSDIEGWVKAIEKLCSNESVASSCRQQSRALASNFVWSRAVEPLRRFCRNPYHLPAHAKVVKPSLIERAHAVYSRGGTDLILRRSREIIGDILRK